jgi:hypothetical protein
LTARAACAHFAGPSKARAVDSPGRPRLHHRSYHSPGSLIVRPCHRRSRGGGGRASGKFETNCDLRPAKRKVPHLRSSTIANKWPTARSKVINLFCVFNKQGKRARLQRDLQQ